MKEINSYTDAKKLRILMGNAKDRGADDVYWGAFKRLCEVSAIGEDQLTRDFNSIMTAYEELLSQKAASQFVQAALGQKRRSTGLSKFFKIGRIARSLLVALRYWRNVTCSNLRVSIL